MSEWNSRFAGKALEALDFDSDSVGVGVTRPYAGVEGGGEGVVGVVGELEMEEGLSTALFIYASEVETPDQRLFQLL